MTENTIARLVRYGMLFAAGMGLVLTFGFVTQQTWATMLIPWELDRLSCIFLASICAASSLPILWIVLTEENAATTGGALNFCVLFLGFALFSFEVYSANPRQPVLLFGIYCVLGFLVSVGLLFFGWRQKFRDTRPMPTLVRISFAIFAVALILTGAALVLKQPNVFPWTLTPQQSVLYGWIFLGAAMYFIFGLLRPFWGNAQGQLLGFLAYDLILIVPCVALLFGSEPFSPVSLLLYIVILTYSGALAVFYLFLNAETRISFQSGTRG